MIQKYWKTYHLPHSLCLTSDDKFMSKEQYAYLSSLEDVVATEKKDGECRNYYSEITFARSMNSDIMMNDFFRQARSYVLSLYGRIKHDIPEDIGIHGEDLYAKHSIYYEHLKDYYQVFNMSQIDIMLSCSREARMLSWNEIVEYCELLDLTHVPVLYRGKYDESLIKSLYTERNMLGDEVEGFVVRNAQSFLLSEFTWNVGKFVRRNHVQTDEHWSHQPLIINKFHTNT